jgi:hypothetical protein
MIEKVSDYLLKGPSAHLYLELHEPLPKLLRNPNSLPPRRHHTQISRHIDIKISMNKGAKISMYQDIDGKKGSFILIRIYRLEERG